MALLHLHSRGVAHLDVKPDNFLVNSQGGLDVRVGLEPLGAEVAGGALLE
jgi:serine/threonine protein kinase